MFLLNERVKILKTKDKIINDKECTVVGYYGDNGSIVLFDDEIDAVVWETQGGYSIRRARAIVLPNNFLEKL